MTEEENKEDQSNLIYVLPECFMMTWEELMPQDMTYGMKYQNSRTTKYPQMGGDTSNCKQPNTHKWGETFQTPSK